MTAIQKLRWGFVGLVCAIILVAVVSFAALSSIERQQDEISQDNLPVVFSMYRLNQMSFQTAEIIQKLPLTTTEFELGLLFSALDDAAAQIAEAVGDLRLQADAAVLSPVLEAVDRINQLSDNARQQALDRVRRGAQVGTRLERLVEASSNLLRLAEDAVTKVSLKAAAPEAAHEDVVLLRKVFVMHGLANQIGSDVRGIRSSATVSDVSEFSSLLKLNMRSLIQSLTRAPVFDGREDLKNAAIIVNDLAILEDTLDLRLDQVKAVDAQRQTLEALFDHVSDLQVASGYLATSQRAVTLEKSALMSQTVQQFSSGVLVFSLLAVLGTGFFVYFVVERQIARRLQRVHDHAALIEAGDLTEQRPFRGSDEIASLGQSVARLRALSLKRKRIETELLKARQSAETLATAKTEFLAMMSHEVRTPLNSITGIFELIERADIPDRQKVRAQKGKVAARQLFDLLSKILDASRIEAGNMDVVPEPVVVSEIAEYLDDMLTGAIARGEKPIQAKVVVDTKAEKIVTDPLLIRQILGNLIDNAVRFTEAGTVSVVLSDDPTGQNILVDVSDTGIGISDKDQAFIFEPFRQVDCGMRRTAGGSGLGLSISRNLANLLGGELLCTSTPGVGSTFSLKLPIGEQIGTKYAQQDFAG